MMPATVQHLVKVGQQAGEPGRALKYDPAFCQMIRDMAQNGQFPEEWCGPIGVTLETMRLWGKRYPEFHDALIISRHLLAAYWSNAARVSVAAKGVNQAVLIQILKSRFPEFYGNNPADVWHFLHSDDGAWRRESDAVPPPADAGFDRNLSEAEIVERLAVLRKRRESEAEK